MDFCHALTLMESGEKTRRVNWGAVKGYVYLNVEDDPVLMSVSNFGYESRWTFSQPDILADDWRLVE